VEKQGRGAVMASADDTVLAHDGRWSRVTRLCIKKESIAFPAQQPRIITTGKVAAQLIVAVPMKLSDD